MMQDREQAERWSRLTRKQRDCLDLLLERKTSKEIARILQITDHAVDLRLTNARMTLGARNRAETALIYERLLKTYGQMTCQSPLLTSRNRSGPPSAMLASVASYCSRYWGLRRRNS